MEGLCSARFIYRTKEELNFRQQWRQRSVGYLSFRAGSYWSPWSGVNCVVIVCRPVCRDSSPIDPTGPVRALGGIGRRSRMRPSVRTYITLATN